MDQERTCARSGPGRPGPVATYARIGELVQGLLAPTRPFLVPGPLDARFKTTTWLEPDRDGAWIAGLREKARRAALLFLARQHEPRATAPPAAQAEPTASLVALLGGYGIRQTSNIPVGKGLGSSSADVLGVLGVLDDFFGTGYDARQLYAFAARIEPTDPCLAPQPWGVFDAHRGRFRRTLRPPPLDILYVDALPEASVDTLAMTARRRAAGVDYAAYRRLLDRFVGAVEAGDLPRLFEATTESAARNQDLLPLPSFETVRGVAAREGAGVFVAHSGTYLGLLAEQGRGPALLEAVQAEVPGLWHTQFVQIPARRAEETGFRGR